MTEMLAEIRSRVERNWYAGDTNTYKALNDLLALAAQEPAAKVADERSDEHYVGAGISACLQIIEVTRYAAEVNPWNRPGEKEYVEPAMRHLAKVIGGLQVGKILADKPHCDELIEWAGRRAAELRAAKVAEDTGDWLWGKLMDWCKKRGVPPAEYDDLFKIVEDFRAAQARTAQAERSDDVG